MAKNIISATATVTRTAPVGGVVSGVPFILGSEMLIPLSTKDAGLPVACVVEGRVFLPFKDGDTWATQGLPVYWNGTSGECEAADTATNYLCGTYDGAHDDTHARVLFNGRKLPASGKDIDAAVALANTALQPVASPTAGNFAGLDANGKPTDSGHKHADYATAAQGVLADSALQAANAAISIATVTLTNHVGTLAEGKRLGPGLPTSSDGGSFFLVVYAGTPVKSGGATPATLVYDPTARTLTAASDETVTELKVPVCG